MVKDFTLIFVTLFFSMSLSGNIGSQLVAHFKAALAGNPDHCEEGDFWDFRQKYTDSVFEGRVQALFNFCEFLENNKDKKTTCTLSNLVHEFADKHPKSASQLLEDRLGFAKSAAELALLEIEGP